MWGRLTFVVAALVLLPMPGWSQMRGARAGPARVGINGMHAQAFHGAVSRPFARRGYSPAFGSEFRSNFRSNFHSGFHRSFRHRRRDLGGVLPFDYAYSGYYPWYPLFDNGYDSADEEQNYEPQIPEPSEELEPLLDQPMPFRSMATPPARCLSRNEPASVPTTTLVFRNGKTQQVQNYAIVGQTLWVFNQQQQEKIPVSELDVSATQALNEKRGVSFQLPQ